MKLNTKSLILIGLFTSLIAVGAFIKIPFLIVPITLQTLFVILCGLILNKREALYSVLLYIFMGLMGFPIFASGGGLTYIYQPSFGYLIGFIFGVLVIGEYKEKFKSKFLLSVLGLLVIYFLGLLYFSFIQIIINGKVYEFSWLIYNLVLIFLPGDLLSCYIASIVSERVTPN